MKNESSNGPFVQETKIPTPLLEKRTAFFISAILFGYLLLRAAYNEPLHDEVATYLHYIYHGDFYGKNLVWDANNHLLNSALGNWMYPVVKDNFFWLRMPNVLAFLLYAWALFNFTQLLSRPWLRMIGFLSIVCIPFVLEYFAYTRGYGLSLGLLLGSLWLLYKFLKTDSTQSLSLGFLLLLLAVSANLTLVNSALLTAFVVLLNHFVSGRKQSKSWRLRFWIATLSFFLLLLPLIYFGFLLKEKGALYYGSDAGFWEITGSSLSEFTLFSHHFSLSIILFLTLVVIGFAAALFLLKTNWKEAIKKPLLLFSFLLFGNIAAIFVFQHLFGVNFPEDRTAMYLIPFFLLSLLFAFDFLKWSKAMIVLLFFPISLLFNFSIHSSVFSPGDRMTNAFYQKVKKHLLPERSLMTHGIMILTYPLHESHSTSKSSMANSYNPNSVLSDILVTKSAALTNPQIPILYDTIATDPQAGYVAFKRKKSLEKEVLTEKQVANYHGNAEYLNFLDTVLAQDFSKEGLQLTLKGQLKTFLPQNKLQLVVVLANEQNEMVDYWWYPFDLSYQGEKINDYFQLHFLFDKIVQKNYKITAYIWNRNQLDFQLENGKCYLYHLKQ